VKLWAIFAAKENEMKRQNFYTKIDQELFKFVAAKISEVNRYISRGDLVIFDGLIHTRPLDNNDIIAIFGAKIVNSDLQYSFPSKREINEILGRFRIFDKRHQITIK